MLACTALIAAVAMLFGVSWQIALVAGLGLALSPTAIALQVIGERNLLPTSSGQAAFSILLFQDVAAIPILALLPLLGLAAASGQEASASGAALEAARIIGVVGGIVLGGRLLLRPLLRMIANSGTPEIFTAAALLLSPLLLVAIDKWLLPRWAGSQTHKLPEISEPQDAPVVIAGFGRYGQIVGRLLLAQGITPTVLDHDADVIENLAAFGYRVFYGDATRLDLLRTAGSARARMLVIAVDDVAQSLKIADVAKAHFPQLQMVAGAHDVVHAYALRERGVKLVERELFESSLRSARSVLELLGQAPYEARQNAMRFRQHNLALFEQMLPLRKDRGKLIAVARQGRLQLEEQMTTERAEQARRGPGGSEGWK